MFRNEPDLIYETEILWSKNQFKKIGIDIDNCNLGGWVDVVFILLFVLFVLFSFHKNWWFYLYIYDLQISYTIIVIIIIIRNIF